MTAPTKTELRKRISAWRARALTAERGLAQTAFERDEAQRREKKLHSALSDLVAVTQNKVSDIDQWALQRALVHLGRTARSQD